MTTFAQAMRDALRVDDTGRLLTAPDSSMPRREIITGDAANAFRLLSRVLSKTPLLEKASDEIGAPRVGESEDEFVARGLAVFEKRLLKALTTSRKHEAD